MQKFEMQHLQLGIIREIRRRAAIHSEMEDVKKNKKQLILNLLFFPQWWNVCAECFSPGSVRNCVCLWPVIDNAAQAAPPSPPLPPTLWSAEREPA